MLVILGAITAAILAGSIIYMTVKLTISALKEYKKRKKSKILAASVGDLVKNGSIPHHALDDLDEDDIVLAEYDTEEDELVQDISDWNDSDEKVRNFLKSNGGIVVFD